MNQELPPLRSALLDVTNHADKRSFSSISTTSGDAENLQVTKKACLRLDSFNNKENRSPPPPPTTTTPLPTPGDNAGAVDLQGKTENKSSIMDNDNDLYNITDSNKDEYFESQESRCCGVDGDRDLMKTCRCSFCFGAGKLLSDLHYEDIKGRLAVINKSQKEARVLVNRNTMDARSGHVSNMDSDLTGRWKSLFLHMEDVFLREAAQLETSLSTLKELRDN